MNSKAQHARQLHEQDEDDGSVSSTEEYLHSVFQLGNSTHKFIVTVVINGVTIDMEAHSGTERSTIPWTIFQDRLLRSCELLSSSVKLHQYDHSPLRVNVGQK